MPNSLILRLSILLQTRDTQTQFNILKPLLSTIPCNQSYCKWFGRLNYSETFMTLSLKDRGWFTDQDNIHLLEEVDLSSLSCLTISGLFPNLCFTMDPLLKQSFSACTDSL